MEQFPSKATRAARNAGQRRMLIPGPEVIKSGEIMLHMNNFSGIIAAGIFLIAGNAALAQEMAAISNSTSSEFATFEAPNAGAGSYQGTVALGINSSGEVVGMYIDAKGLTHGFVRAAGGTITEFDAPQAGTGKKQGTFPIGLNDSGEVVGTYIDAQNDSHGFVWADSGAIFFTIDAPGAVPPGTTATCINASGAVTGYFRSISGNAPHGFVRTAGGEFTVIDAPGAGTDYGQGTNASCINAAGEITGRYGDSQGAGHGFVRSGAGVFTSFAVSSAEGSNDTFPSTTPLSIDAAGNVAGFYEDVNGEQHSFLRTAAGVLTKFDVPGASSDPCPVNNGTPGPHLWFCGTGAMSIDSTRGITGGFVDPQGAMRGYVRSVSGAFSTFDAPNAGTGEDGAFEGTAGFGMNSAAAIAGSYIDRNLVIHGFVFAPASRVATTTTLTASRTSSVYLEPVTLAARVAAGSETAPNGGSVTFMAGDKSIGTEKTESGKAELTTTELPVGTDSVTAVYAGGSGFAGSTSKAGKESVGKATSSVSLAAKPNPVAAGDEVTFTAIVKGQFGGTATGSVTFFDGTKVLKTVSLSAAKATCSTSSLGEGAHSIKAVYAGDEHFKESSSEALTVTVTK